MYWLALISLAFLNQAGPQKVKTRPSVWDHKANYTFYRVNFSYPLTKANVPLNHYKDVSWIINLRTSEQPSSSSDSQTNKCYLIHIVSLLCPNKEQPLYRKRKKKKICWWLADGWQITQRNMCNIHAAKDLNLRTWEWDDFQEDMLD